MKAFDLSVSGSLYVTGSIKTADGTFMLSGSTPDASSSFSTRTTNLETHSGTSKTLVSSSAQIATDISGSFTAVSSSLASRITSEESDFTAAGISGSITSTSSSIATRFDSRETDMTLATASIASNESNMTLATASIAAITASVSTINSNMTLATASIAAITASVSTLKSNVGQELNTDSAVTFTTVNTGQGANELYDMDQNVKTDSAVTFATVDTGQGANELYDMDQNVLTTSSPTFAGVTATGTITAQEFHTEFVSASVVFESGSTKFGDTQDDIHQFTGSIQQSGSTGNHYFQTGNVGIGTTSPGAALEVIGSVSGSSTSTGSFGALKTGDIELENERGHWKIVEEEEYLSIYNVKTNKKFKFVLEEIE